MYTTSDYLAELDIRIGTVVNVEPYSKKAYYLAIDFGDVVGVRRALANLAMNYDIDEIMGRQVLGVLNLPGVGMGDEMINATILGVRTAKGIILLRPDNKVQNGDRVE